jgi:basic amino acid/polyamine antiporter, APA family
MFAGALFALTAKTYAAGATMFPEAGGSSSFARHAFNELVSFIAGWALMLDYLLTIGWCSGWGSTSSTAATRDSLWRM